MEPLFERALVCAMRRGGCPWLPGLVALRTFRAAVETVPAYHDLLTQWGVPIHRIASLRAFRAHVPIVDRATYLNRYPVDLLCRGGTFETAYRLVRSETDQGSRLQVFGRAEHDDFVRNVDGLLGERLEGRRRRTLVVIVARDEGWPFGDRFVHTVEALVRSRRIRGATCIAATDTYASIGAVRTGLRVYDQAIFVGTHDSLMEPFNTGRLQEFTQGFKCIHALVIDSSETRSVRPAVAEAVGGMSAIRRCGRQLIRWSSLGAEEAGPCIETPLAAMVRRLAADDARLRRDLFGLTDPDVEVQQPHPLRVFAEAIDGRLVFTTGGTVPLVRYDVRRRGGTLPLCRVESILRDHGYNLPALLTRAGWRPHTVSPFPLVYAGSHAGGLQTNRRAHQTVARPASAARDKRSEAAAQPTHAEPVTRRPPTAIAPN